MTPEDGRALALGRALLALVAELVPPAARPDDLVALAEAARIAATSCRVVRDAIRTGDLPAFGRERDRAVRRGDLERWIESRRMRPVAGPDDDDIDRRIRRIERRDAARRAGK